MIRDLSSFIECAKSLAMATDSTHLNLCEVDVHQSSTGEENQYNAFAMKSRGAPLQESLGRY